MPGKSKAGRKHIKKSYKKKHNSNVMRITCRNNQPIPKILTTNLTYNSDIYTGTATFGSNSTYQYSLNSIYDPDITSSGHQPYGHDTFASLYTAYRVNYVDVYMRAHQNSTQNAINTVITVRGNTTSPNGSSMEFLGEQPKSVCKTLTHQTGITYHKRYYIADILEVPRKQYMTDASNFTLCGNNPVANCAYNFTYNQWDASTQSAFGMNTKLVYNVTFDDPTILTQS